MSNPYKTLFIGFFLGCLTLTVAWGLVARRDREYMEQLIENSEYQISVKEHENDSLTTLYRPVMDSMVNWKIRDKEREVIKEEKKAPEKKRQKEIPFYNDSTTVSEYRRTMDNYILPKYKNRK